MNLKSKLILFFLGFLSLHIQAQLLQKTERPSVKEVRDYLKEPARYTDDREYLRVAMRNSKMNLWINKIPQHAPQMLATFHNTFPTSTFVFLGRDTAIIADIFEHFYDFHGDIGRVKRLKGSKATYKTDNGIELIYTDNDKLYKFLSKNGLSIEEIMNSPYPITIVDTVSSGRGRQGRYILHCLMTEYANRGQDPLQLLEKVSFVGLQVSTFKQSFDSISPEQVKQNTEITKRNIRNQQMSYFDGYSFPLYPQSNGPQFNEVGYVHYTSSWHDSYSSIASGYTVQPIANFRTEDKAVHLSAMIKTAQMVYQQDFVSSVTRLIGQPQNISRAKQQKTIIQNVAVADSGTKISYDEDSINYYASHFDTRSPDNVVVCSRVARNFKSTISSILGSVKVVNGMSKGARILKDKFHELLTKIGSTPVVVSSYMIDAIREAREAGVIFKRDWKFLFEEVLEHGIISIQLIKRLQLLMEWSDSFAEKRVLKSNWLKSEKAKNNLAIIQEYLRRHSTLDVCRKSFKNGGLN